MSLKPLSILFFKYKIKFENTEFLRTFKSELIGFIISMFFLSSLNKLLIFESVKDHVTAS